MSVLNKIVSYFQGITTTKQGMDIRLLTLLKSNRHKATIERLRNEPDKIKQQLLKEKLPCYTIAGTFSQRCDDGIIQLSGLAAIDLDVAEAYDVIHLLNELKKLNCIAYAGLSCRGKRLFCIVPFKYPEKYVQHYERLIQSFTDMGLPMGDDCHKRLSQPRFISWNDENTQYFNHNAQPYSLLSPEKTYHSIKKSYQKTESGSHPNNPFQWCTAQINKSNAFIEGKRHKYLVKLVRYCNIKGIPEADTLSGCLSFLKDVTEPEQKKIMSIVKNIYSKQSGSFNSIPFT